MKALGMIEVYSFTTAVCVGDVAAKAADVKVIAFDRNRPISPDVPAPLVMIVKIEGEVAAVRAAVEAGVAYAKEKGKYIPYPATYLNGKRWEDERNDANEQNTNAGKVRYGTTL